ncbi:recombinase family protein [Pelotomaculum isophthalicicum JI]|uniref:Recombinase family protein n=1 Tax=Pelotomaculum isophthalicicum JI TaxID=947010 RepID=A0A9X4GZZ8_9FIRM|nr:recombinase family protein [Pelotomaculum isophthalicicum]MDF9409350.1 recombinase family protein [Pelotomaculum isophthalicicum JI]
MKRITKIEANEKLQKAPKKLRVAAYARVSTDSREQLVSLDAQRSHYETCIKSNPNWEYVGLYYDEGISGTSMAKRDGLLKMLDDCEAGKIDFIIIKSISRFARNTTECLEAVRKLIKLKVFIYFEKENINTGDMENELLLTIFSSLAESESISLSENEKWSIEKRFQNGTYIVASPPYGYKNEDGLMVINEDEVDVVRYIFAECLAGKGGHVIARDLNDRGIPTRRKTEWSTGTVNAILRNEKYKGDVLFQKTFTDSSFVRHINNGEKAQYYVTEHHEAIISAEDFEAAQAMIDQRSKDMKIKQGDAKYQNRYPFSGKIVCGECGATWKRRTHSESKVKYFAYACKTHIKRVDQCSMQFIRERNIEVAFLNMINKLVFSKKVLLQPLLASLKDLNQGEALARINKLDEALEDNLNKRQKITELFAKEYLEAAVFNEQNSGLLAEAKQIGDEKEALYASLAHENEHLEALNKLIKYINTVGTLKDFDETAFQEHVEYIIVFKRFEIGFVLKCGLTLRERL